MDEQIKTKADLLNDIFDKIKEEGHIKYIVLVGHGGLTAHYCDSLEKKEADIYAAYAKGMVHFADKFGTQLHKEYKVPEMIFKIKEDTPSERYASKYLIINKMDDDFTLLTKYSWHNPDYLGSVIENINKELGNIMDVLRN